MFFENVRHKPFSERRKPKETMDQNTLWEELIAGEDWASGEQGNEADMLGRTTAQDQAIEAGISFTTPHQIHNRLSQTCATHLLHYPRKGTDLDDDSAGSAFIFGLFRFAYSFSYCFDFPFF
jgi:hypothetical protein